MSRTAPGFRPALETLETRDNPSAAWATEAFDGIAAPVLPTGWASWSTNGEPQFITSKLDALSGINSLASLGSTTDSARFWNRSTFPGDYGAAFSMRVGSSAKQDVLARGTRLDTAIPSYVAAEFTGSRSLELFEVNAGISKSLGRVSSLDSLTGKWIRISLTPVNEWAGVTVQRLDTGAFLKPDGTWQTLEVDAIRVKTSITSTEGAVGVGRRSGGSGMAFVDNFAVLAPPGVNEAFDTTAQSTVPANWRTWSNNQTAAFAVGTGRALSQANGIAANGGSATQSRAWLGSAVAADASASAAIYADNLIPAGVFLRGSQLDSAQPSYYELSLTRGLSVQLKSVVAGTETVLATLASKDYVSGKWIRVTLVAQGGILSAMVQRTDTNRWLQADGTWSSAAATALQVVDTKIAGAGYAGVTRGRAASGAVWFDDFEGRPATAVPAPGDPPPTNHPTDTGGTTPRTDIAHKYTHIRLAQLAYSGNPVGQFEKDLAKNSLDLIVPNPQYLEAFEAAAPGTSKVIYTNLSNVYGSLLTDWNAYADAHGVSRETAFYHVAQATAFSGASPSSQPVNQFWSVQRGNADGTGSPLDLTSAARGTGSGGVVFGAAGAGVALAYTEKFREVNVALAKAASNGWSGALEYVAAVNADGSPKTWKTLTVLQDGTTGLRTNGAILFDPPADWAPSKIAGTSLFQIRIRTTAGTSAQAPVATTILGRDYVQANGRALGTIPAFDSAADANGDGYLSDSEYRNRRAGFDARFVYESRLFYPNYGQMRYVVNPSSTAIQLWNIEESTRILQQNPQADGLFIDNSHGKLPFAGTAVKESVANFTPDYAALVGAITKSIAPKWTVSNTAGSIAEGDPVAKASTAALEEFALRPNTSNWAQVRDLADLVARRLNADNPSPYVILDTYSGSTAMNDPRSRMGSLAYYYLVADPDKTFLMLNGGQSPAAPWSSVWFNAVTVNVGKPTGAMTTWATGGDPANPALTYQVLKREYTNAISLYKPLSYKQATGTGTNADTTATTHQLGGNFRKLNADGTLGPVITSITLRGGEGAVLMRA